MISRRHLLGVLPASVAISGCTSGQDSFESERCPQLPETTEQYCTTGEDIPVELTVEPETVSRNEKVAITVSVSDGSVGINPGTYGYYQWENGSWRARVLEESNHWMELHSEDEFTWELLFDKHTTTSHENPKRMRIPLAPMTVSAENAFSILTRTEERLLSLGARIREERPGDD
ncbi:hypothetical protein [Natranaeroarchaeum aerophilus]|uniref:Lipoprotein n=1 Tax=Natranaeroarchaeum aerophilus TaxID=2917711 RepID=A0AAE3FPZ6_9EURY|nr:hypothetical protein [Natranaeroarchaeum aerophilus]MCL9813517.1 hypothetical protein [Natranaeroarchaeum aerophilus]